MPLKEGIASEPGVGADLAPLLRFPSTRDEGLTSLADYRTRMAEGQGAIYYVLADGLSAAARSPHLDPFRARGLEVLYLCLLYTSDAAAERSSVDLGGRRIIKQKTIRELRRRTHKRPT